MAVVFAGCSDDFLKTSQTPIDQYNLQDTLFIEETSQQYSVTLTLPIDMSEAYTIVAQPKCMTFSSLKGKFNHGNAPFQFSTDMSQLAGRTGDIGQRVILNIDEIGLLVLSVKIGRPHVPESEADPKFYISTSGIQLKDWEPQTFTIENRGGGFVNFQIYDIPYWMTCSAYSGSLNAGESQQIVISASNTNLTEPEYNATIQIYENGQTYNLQVKLLISATVKNSENIKAISGKVTDAEFSTASNKLVIATQQPNQLVIFSRDTVQSVIPLTKSPNCVSISEDGKTAVVGYNQAYVSLIDLESETITKTVEADCIIYDIVLGSGNWCYIVSDTGDFQSLRSLNLATGEIKRSANYSKTYAKMNIRKIPGQPYLLGSNSILYSNGLIMVDISKGIANDTIPYWNIDTNNFWISPDGNRIYTGIKNVFKTPDYVASDNYYYDLPIVAKLPATNENIVWVNQSDAAGSIFVAESSREYDSYEYSLIEEIDPESYNVVRQFNPDKFQTTINGKNWTYTTIVKYVFASIDGKKLFTVRNVLRQYQTDAWSMEMIPVQ